jgi:hypothetical protein
MVSCGKHLDERDKVEEKGRDGGRDTNPLPPRTVVKHRRQGRDAGNSVKDHRYS